MTGHRKATAMVRPASATTDRRPRCSWANPANPAYVAYHDREWGVARRLSDDGLFELLVLEAFQAGLSWETILNKRAAFRAAFRGFSIEKVAALGPRDVERLLQNPGIVRNRAKIEAAVGNARAARALARRHGSFAAFLEPFRPPPVPPLRRGELRCSSVESETLSRVLKKEGFAFVGPKILYSFFQAAGWVDDHEPGCFKARTRRGP